MQADGQGFNSVQSAYLMVPGRTGPWLYPEYQGKEKKGDSEWQFSPSASTVHHSASGDSISKV